MPRFRSRGLSTFMMTLTTRFGRLSANGIDVLGLAVFCALCEIFAFSAYCIPGFWRRSIDKTMPVIYFYFDFISPYAYAAFHQLPQVLAGLAYRVEYRPLVLGALLKAHGSLPPVSIVPKRDWIFRHVQWLAAQQGLPLEMPPVHPFNPLPWLRMALAASPHGQPGRQVCEALFKVVWQGGHDANDAQYQQQVWQEMTALLPAVRNPQDEAVKAELFANGEAALQHGVFGVPAFVLQPDAQSSVAQLFWGVEGLPMLREAVQARQLVQLAGATA